MQHFFVTPEQVQENSIVIEGTDVNHMKNVLRMKLGEEVEISDGNNKRYIGIISEFCEQEIFVNITEIIDIDTELPSRLYLFQGFPKGDKMELIVQKAVELGVYEVIPVMTKRTIVKLDDKKRKKKVERYNAIAESAAKQSARGVIPKVTEVMSYKEAISYAKTKDIVLMPYELAEGMDATKEVVSRIQPGQSIAIFIGPEGGFDKGEVDLAMSEGAIPITLGKRILRTETAGLTILSILMFQLDSM